MQKKSEVGELERVRNEMAAMNKTLESLVAVVGELHDQNVELANCMNAMSATMAPKRKARDCMESPQTVPFHQHWVSRGLEARAASVFEEKDSSAPKAYFGSLPRQFKSARHSAFKNRAPSQCSSDEGDPPVGSPTSVRGFPKSPNYSPTSVRGFPKSPNYSPTSGRGSPKSPDYSPPDEDDKEYKEYRPTRSPTHSPTRSPTYAAYDPMDPIYDPMKASYASENFRAEVAGLI
tara:strand:- start:64 stop:765 length:702 start_codon:yes stop_codon:yes gene_type:complete